MLRFFRRSIFILLLLFFSGVSFSHPKTTRSLIIKKTLDEWELRLGLKTGYLDGEMNYVIKPAPYKSKLDFPLGNWLYGGEILIGRKPLYLGFEFYKEIWQTASGDMEDKDWFLGNLFSYTKSDSEVKLKIQNVYLKFCIWEGKNFWKGISEDKYQRLFFLAGYLYERFKYRILGIRNVLAGGSSYEGKEVLAYKAEYTVPYIGIEGECIYEIDNYSLSKFFKNLGISGYIAGSPYTKAKHRDDHILRNKLSHGDCDGWAVLAGLKIFIKTNKNWEINFGLDYLNIETDGKQSQYWYGDDPLTAYDDTGTCIDGIDLEIKQHYKFYWMSLVYRF